MAGKPIERLPPGPVELSSNVTSTFLSDDRQANRIGLPAIRERQLVLGAIRPHTVGYIGGCDQEQGEIECPCRERLRTLVSLNLRTMDLLGPVTRVKKKK